MKPTRIDINQSAYDHTFNVAVFFGKELQTFRCVPEEITRQGTQVWGVYHTNGENRNVRQRTFNEPLPENTGKNVELAYCSGILSTAEWAMEIMRKRMADAESK